MRLKPRVEALESRSTKPQRWVRVFQESDQTEEQAIAAHEAENGPIGDANVILVHFVDPVRPCA